MKKQIILLLLLPAFFACHKFDKEAYLEQRTKNVSKEYKERMEEVYFPKRTFNHFPDSIERLPIKQAYGFPKKDKAEYNSNSMCIMLFEYYISNHARLVIQKYLAKYQPSNDSLLVIRQERKNTYWKGWKSYRDVNIESSGFYPIPFFKKEEYEHPEEVVTTEDVYSDSTFCGLSKDFTIYVLDSEPGIYAENLEPLKFMPEGWKNGYSKGICINEKKKIVIYWTLVW